MMGATKLRIPEGHKVMAILDDDSGIKLRYENLPAGQYHQLNESINNRCKYMRRSGDDIQIGYKSKSEMKGSGRSGQIICNQPHC